MKQDIDKADLVKAWARLARAAGESGQPHFLFEQFSGVCDEIFGHKLLTLLSWHPESNDTQRAFSTQPEEYPVGARKPMGATEWGDLLLKQGQSWIGTTREDIRWAFFDFRLIEELGCGACLSVPVRWNGVTLAAVSVLGPTGAYQPEQLDTLGLLSSFLVPAFVTSSDV